MCNPTAANLAMGSSVAAGVLQAYGIHYQATMEERGLNYQKKMAQRAAMEIEETGRAAEKQQRMATARAVGAQRAAMGGSGIDVNTGSFLDTQVETAQLGEMDALMIRQNYEREARVKRAEASMYRAGAEAARTTGRLGVATSLLTTGGSVADMYYRYNPPQPPPQPYRTSGNIYQARPNYYSRRKEPYWS